jgi:hypothetical protein
MIIDNLRSEKNKTRTRVSAAVSWEDSDRPAQEVFFETEEAYGEGLSCNPNAFIIAAAVAAMHHGEKRVRIEEEICPQLKDGLLTAMGWLRHWYDSLSPITIEARTQRSSPYQGTPRRAATFFSGGIDALASLRWNRLNYPADHPLSFKDGILVYGLEIYKPEAFEYVREILKVLARDANLTLVPIYTNVRYLDEDWTFWENEFEGAVFASIAHALVPRFSAVSVASSVCIHDSHPHGSHPLLDPNYSSNELQIRHELITLSRYERTQLVAGWDTALQSMRVCNHIEEYRSHILNCGKCEKCVRTMLALLALGVLKNAAAFPKRDLSEEEVNAMKSLSAQVFSYYQELLGPLSEAGRHDLVRAVKRLMADCYRNVKKQNARKLLIDPIIEFDEKNFGGSLRRMKRLILPKGIWTNP